MHEKLKFEQIKKDSCASLRYDYSSLYPKDEMPLHFHPEIEICYVVKGSGYRMIGDFLEPFEEGEVVLVPTNQPHCWMYNPESCEPDGKRRCIVVQFNPDLLQTGLSFFTEWEYAAHRLSAIQQGILLDRRNSRKNQILLRRNEPPECKRKDADVDTHPATNRNHNRFNPYRFAGNGIQRHYQKHATYATDLQIRHRVLQGENNSFGRRKRNQHEHNGVLLVFQT